MFGNELMKLKTGRTHLLRIKESQIRMSILEQAFSSVDKGVHIGGCFSSVIPMVCLYYGGIISVDVENPTTLGQDKFVLSKGHSVALMASIFSDLGYFDKSVLSNSRSIDSILNGHPGPILPGFDISTGPLGQGIAAASGFALIGRGENNFDVYCLVGDGELQEGILWEPVMYAAHKKLDNFCVIVDRNMGQLDDVKKNIINMGDVAAKFEAFGWNAVEVDATNISPVYDALEEFKYGKRNGRPTAIICVSDKGFGGHSKAMTGHKITITEEIYRHEYSLHQKALEQRIKTFNDWFNTQNDNELKQQIVDMAMNMNISIKNINAGVETSCFQVPVRLKKAAERDKTIKYDSSALPVVEKGNKYQASEIIKKAMEVFAKDDRVVSIDSDLSSTSGLLDGVSVVDRERALNVGIAEPNMMGIGEAFAVCGYNVWMSTFCPFFDWRVMRRIAIGYQERLEAIEQDTWLSEGHDLDITFLATAANLDTVTNGATHMGNDDIMVFDEIAHLKIIDVSCPRQLLSIMKWIMEGNKGLVYLRIMRAVSGVLYDEDYQFEYGKGYTVVQNDDAQIAIISSGRCVHEGVNAAEILKNKGITVDVVDMPSIDSGMLECLYEKYKLLVFAEQNNGYIYKNFLRTMFGTGKVVDTGKVLPINLLDENGRKRFIHSGTINELTDRYGLSGMRIAERILSQYGGAGI
jgi:transketolase